LRGALISVLDTRCYYSVDILKLRTCLPVLLLHRPSHRGLMKPFTKILMATDHGTNSPKIVTARLIEVSVLDLRQLYDICTVENVKILFNRE
jgi:hypothetical protein